MELHVSNDRAYLGTISKEDAEKRSAIIEKVVVKSQNIPRTNRRISSQTAKLKQQILARKIDYEKVGLWAAIQTQINQQAVPKSKDTAK